MLKLAVAASGGADSTALLLEAARRFRPDDVIALAVDHRTRTAAADERAHVARLAGLFGFAFRELAIGRAAPHQAAWREARLAALLRFCEGAGIGRLWLGHHADDAVETAAMRLLAVGPLTGSAGISAARRSGKVWIERPLLNRTGRALRRDLMQAGIGWLEDPSNRDRAYTRVAVREVLQETDRAWAALLVRRAGRWRAEQSLLLAAAWRAAAETTPVGGVLLAPAMLRSMPDGLAALVLRAAALAVAGRAQRLRRADFAGALKGGPPWQLGGVRVLAHAGRWLAIRDFRHIREAVPLEAGRCLVWDNRYRLDPPARLPAGAWRVARLGAMAARRLLPDCPAAAAWPAEALAALPALWHGEALAGVPPLGLWRGPERRFWVAHLAGEWSGLEAPESFWLAP